MILLRIFIENYFARRTGLAPSFQSSLLISKAQVQAKKLYRLRFKSIPEFKNTPHGCFYLCILIENVRTELMKSEVTPYIPNLKA